MGLQDTAVSRAQITVLDAGYANPQWQMLEGDDTKSSGEPPVEGPNAQSAAPKAPPPPFPPPPKPPGDTLACCPPIHRITISNSMHGCRFDRGFQTHKVFVYTHSCYGAMHHQM